MEPTLSLFAWIGVILLQVMVHRYLRARRRHPSIRDDDPARLVAAANDTSDGCHSAPRLDPPAAERSEAIFRSRALSVDAAGQLDRAPSTVGTEGSPSRDSVRREELREDERNPLRMDSLDFDEADEPSFDGDEPRLFFQLLSQTGSEMMTSRRSLEHLVREQMDDRPTVLCS